MFETFMGILFPSSKFMRTRFFQTVIVLKFVHIWPLASATGLPDYLISPWLMFGTQLLLCWRKQLASQRFPCSIS